MMSNGEASSRRLHPACLLLVTVSLLFMAGYLAVALLRMNHPFELEWMEGGTLVNVTRILNGQGIYVRPSPEYAPYFYTPMYYYSGAAWARLLGDGFMPLRLLSILFSIGGFVWLFMIVHRRDGNIVAGLAAVGLYASAYWMTGQWYDLGRVDSMFMFLFLAALYCMLHGRGAASAGLAGLFVALAYLTKQTAAAMAFWVFVSEIFRQPKRAGIFAGAAAGLILSATAVFNLMTDGWYVYVTQKLMLNQHYILSSIYTFWTHDMLTRLPVCVGCAVWLFLRSLRSGDRNAALQVALLGVGMVGASWISRINIGGYRNVLIPAVAYAAIVLGWALSDQMREPAAQGRPRRAWLMPVLAVVQMAWLQISPLTLQFARPWEWVPSAEDREAGMAFVRELRAIEGNVLLPNHPYLLLMAGKQPCAHTAGVDDVIRGDNGEVERDLTGEIRRRISAGEYAAIVLEREWVFRRDAERHYQFDRRIFANEEVFFPVTGWQTRPEEIWVPKREDAKSIESPPQTP